MTLDPHGRGAPVNAVDGGTRGARFAHRAMACTWEIVVVGLPPREAEHAARAAFDEIDRLEQELSRFAPQGDVARINALRPGTWLRIGPDAFECLDLAARLHAETGGAFDVTVGALLNRASTDAAVRRTASGPASAATAVAEAGAGAASTQSDAPSPAGTPVGMAHLRIDRAARSVAVDVERLVVDLGGIGKGFAIDRAVELLRGWGVAAALVHSGESTVSALGAPAGESGWPIGIRHPCDATRTLGTLRLRDCAMSGSGARLHGRHIIDPRSGESARAEAAWSAAPSAAVSDGLSTAFMVMSEAEIRAYCRRSPGVAAGVFHRDAAQPQGRVCWIGTPPEGAGLQIARAE